MGRSKQLFTLIMNIIYPKEMSELIKYLLKFKCILVNIQTVCPQVKTYLTRKYEGVGYGNFTCAVFKWGM